MSEPNTPGGTSLAREHAEDPGWVVIVGDDGAIYRVNPATAGVFGYRPEELEGADAFAHVHPEDAPRVWAAFARDLDRPGLHGPVGCRVRVRDGTYREVEVAADNRLSDPEVRGVMLELKAADGRAADGRLRGLAERIPAVTYAVRLDGPGCPTAYVSPQSRRMLGYPPEEWLADPGFRAAILHPEDRERVLAAVVRVRDGLWEPAPEGGELPALEYRLLSRDGSTVWVRDQAAVMGEPGGDRLLCGVLLDISEQKRTEDALRESRRRYQAVVEDQTEMISRFGPDFGITFANEANCRYFGLSREEFVGKDLLDMIPEDGRRGLKERLLSLTPEYPTMTHEHLAEVPGAGVRWTRWTHRAIFDGRGRVVEYHGVGRDVTEQREARARLRESEERFRAVIEQTIEGVYLGDVQERRLTHANTAFREMLGYGDAAELEGMRVRDFIAHDPEDIEAVYQRILEAGHLFIGERRYRRKDGSMVDVEASATVISHDGKRTMCTVVRDVTSRKRAEASLRESEERFRQLFEQSVDAVVVHDAEGRILDVNRLSCRSLGYSREELLSMNVGDYETKLLSSAERAQRERSGGTLWQRIVANEPGTVSGTHAGENRRKDGTTFPVEVKMGGVDYGGDRVILSSVRDVTERRALEERLRHQALHDPLTGLPGRELLTGRLRDALARAGRVGGHAAVLFVDVDNLKLVNDSLGHEAGDRLLRAAGERLRGCVGEQDTVARFGGDEFVVLLGGAGAEDEARAVAERVLLGMGQPLRIDGREVPMTASVGLAMGPVSEASGGSPANAAGDLIRHADAAMYRAKSAGGGAYAVFDPGMDRADPERLQLSGDLRHAMERGELRVHYQHKVDLSTGGVSGWEALLRWEHPERGEVSPETFIPLAEENGLIIPIGRWVIVEACQQARIWRDRHPKEPGQFMSVNLSPKQFADPDLEDCIEGALRRTGLPAGALDLEITETVLVEDEVSDFARIRELKGLGITFSLDDFGTGYSSLLSLKQLPVDSIKIDRAFVDRVPGTPADEAFVVAMVALARALGLAVVAEGIERGEQRRRLLELGCDYGQGFHFARPLPPAKATRAMDLLEEAAGNAGPDGQEGA